MFASITACELNDSRKRLAPHYDQQRQMCINDHSVHNQAFFFFFVPNSFLECTDSTCCIWPALEACSLATVTSDSNFKGQSSE